jgi:hypothetical protein
VEKEIQTIIGEIEVCQSKILECCDNNKPNSATISKTINILTEESSGDQELSYALSQASRNLKVISGNLSSISEKLNALKQRLTDIQQETFLNKKDLGF